LVCSIVVVVGRLARRTWGFCVCGGGGGGSWTEQTLVTECMRVNMKAVIWPLGMKQVVCYIFIHHSLGVCVYSFKFMHCNHSFPDIIAFF
jgi:hypothetical protein